MAGKRGAGWDRGKVVRFAWLSDPHLSVNPDLAAYRQRFAEAMAGVRDAAAQFALITGDLVDDADAASYALFRTMVRVLPGACYCVPGNHDVGEKRFAGAPPGSVVTGERLERFRAEIGPTWHAVQAGEAHFLLLTSSLFGSGLPDEGEQWAWLESELARRRGEALYLVLHHPLFLERPDEPGGTYWNIEPEPRARLLALLEAYHIRAVFTGHIHRDLHGRYGETELLTQTAVSFGLGAPEQRVEGWSIVTLNGGEPEVDFRRLTPGGIPIRETG